MAFNVGDKVSFLNETGEGVVTKILNDSEVEVETEDGFSFTYPIGELVKVTLEGYEYHGPGYEDLKDEKPSFGQKKQVLDHWMRKVGKQVVPVVDLHLHELLNDPNSLKNWEKPEYQMNYFKNCLHEAISRKIQRIIFVHGVGEGVLREKIHKYLAERHDVEYNDAPIREFGHGATEVRLFGLFN